MMMPSIFGNNFVDDVFDDMFPFAGGYTTANYDLMKTDVKDVGDHYELEMEMPGVEKENIKAELKDGYLTVTAQQNTNKDGKGPRVVSRRLGNVFIDIRRTQFHVLLLDCLLVDGTVGSEHIRVDRIEMHIDVRHSVVECGGVVILVALARGRDDRQAGYRQMVVVDEILRVLKLHSVPIGCEDLGLVIASWHRDDHLAYLRRGDEKHFILCVVGPQFQMAKVHSRLVETTPVRDKIAISCM